ncbi:oligosaccharide flippase family protein, partial [Escherichia sp. TWPC-MK]
RNCCPWGITTNASDNVLINGANSIIQRKEISHLELTTLYWLNVGLGIVVCVAVFLLSDLIGDVLNNPDLAPLIKTLSLAFVVIPHGQQFRALM